MGINLEEKENEILKNGISFYKNQFKRRTDER